MTKLLATTPIQLVNFFPDFGAGIATGFTLQAVANEAQTTPEGRARLALALAFLNATPDAPGQPAPPANDPNAVEAAQFASMFSGSFPIIAFVNAARPWIEMSAGGNASWTLGEDFSSVLDHSPYADTVRALYREAGLDLRGDLATLTAGADIPADPTAIQSLEQTSVPTGHLQVPELDLHTIHDPLVPVEMENQYAAAVRAAGSNSLFRQAFVDRFGHCAFSASEIVAGVEAVNHRIETGQWDSVAQPQKLEDFATSLGLDPARSSRTSRSRSRATTDYSTRQGTSRGELTSRSRRRRSRCRRDRFTGKSLANSDRNCAHRERQRPVGAADQLRGGTTRTSSPRRHRGARAPYGLTTLQYTTLSVLNRHGSPLSNAQLARRAYMTPQAMSEVIDALAAKGLIRRSRHPNHGRLLPAALTPKGRRVLAECEREVDDMEAVMLGSLTGRERTAFLAALKSCVRALGAGFRRLRRSMDGAVMWGAGSQRRTVERRGWDSNPGSPLRLSGFQDRPVRPLRHPAVPPFKPIGPRARLAGARREEGRSTSSLGPLGPDARGLGAAFAPYTPWHGDLRAVRHGQPGHREVLHGLRIAARRRHAAARASAEA